MLTNCLASRVVQFLKVELLAVALCTSATSSTQEKGVAKGNQPAFIPVGYACWRAGSLQGLLPGAPTDPGVHVKCTRFVTL